MQRTKTESVQAHQSQYPTLYRIALDVLPIQASAVPCERVFSSSKETFTARRTNLNDEHMEILQIAKYLIIQERHGLDFSSGRLMTPEELLEKCKDLPDELDLDEDFFSW